MKILQILNKAKYVTNDDELNALLELIKSEFSKHKMLSHLSIFNPDSSIDNGAPYVKLDFVKEYSGTYIASITPELRDGKFTVIIQIVKTNDGLGTSSQSWETIEKDVITPYEDKNIEDAAERAVEIAIMFHRRLIEELGIPQHAAEMAAKAAW